MPAPEGMKSIFVSLLFVAAPAIAGPDFHTPTPRGGNLTASHGTREILPSEDVTFRHDSSALDENAVSQLDSVARAMRARTDLRIVVEGYADHTGEAAYNVRLARLRAHAARAHLIRRGIPGDRIVIGVFGESVADPAGNPLDRRVVIYATPLSVGAISTALLERHAIRTLWTARGAAFAEERTPTVVRITRR
jgi:hypothetical protein